jgi:drug/metabolite transporter (DMT)-like permease
MSGVASSRRGQPSHASRESPILALSLLWIPATLIAASAQTARNAAQRGLVDEIGTAGATQARFLYGLPFALLFLALVALSAGRAPPVPDADALLYTLLGAVSQIAATALMLLAMKERSFAVTTAFIKTEPILTALVGVVVLDDALGPMKALSILVATAGVMLMGLKQGFGVRLVDEARPVLLGVAAGGLFGLSAVAFRGAITGLPEAGFVLRASTILVWGLAMQTALLVGWMALTQRVLLLKCLAAWRVSLGAGLLGALASQFWFIGFALTTAANVRTLALVEVFMARAAGGALFSEKTSRRELIGMALVVLGVSGVLLA